MRVFLLLAFLLCSKGKLLLFDNAYIDDAIHDVYEGMHMNDSDQMPESDFITGTKHYLDEFQGTGVRCASVTACGNDNDCSKLVNWLRSMDAKSNWRQRHPHILRVFREHLNPEGTKTRIAEVGIARGDLSHEMTKALLKDGGNVEYHGIDPFFGSYDQKDAFSKLLSSIGNSSRWADAILQNLGDLGCNFILHHKPSLLAVGDFQNSSLDVIFLDGDHTYSGLVFDIRAWFPKLKKGGILGFDDFGWNFPGVVRAAVEFSLCHNSSLHPMYGSHGNVFLHKTAEHMPVVAGNVTIFGEHHVNCHEYLYE